MRNVAVRWEEALIDMRRSLARVAQVVVMLVVVGVALASAGCAGQPSVSGRLTQYDVLEGAASASDPPRLCDVASGPDGNIWFTVFGTKRIGRLAPDGSVTSFPLSDASGSPCSVIPGPDGNLWFTE